MQAIMETLFDIVYLSSVITIGILMIRGSKGVRQFRLFRSQRQTGGFLLPSVTVKSTGV